MIVRSFTPGLALLVSLIVSLANFVAAQEVEGRLAEGTALETTFYIKDSQREGPVVLIVAGMHGNEPAGPAAMQIIRDWEITSGKLIIVPEANTLGLKQNVRGVPVDAANAPDLNRSFPAKDDDTSATSPLARGLWDLVEQHRPHWLLDLHEGYDFNQLNGKSVGSTIIAVPTARQAALPMISAVNRIVDDQKKSFLLRSPPVVGSLARAAAEEYNIPTMILETTSKRQPLSLRSLQHQIMVYSLLVQLHMVSDGVHRLSELQQQGQRLVADQGKKPVLHVAAQPSP